MPERSLTAADVAAFERCIASDGVALFPADTVYGLAIDPESSAALDRLYRIKGRPRDRPAAVMFFSLEALLETLGAVPAITRAAVERLLPGPVTLVLANPQRRFPLACGPVPERLGVRIPALSGRLAALAAMRRPVLQSSANLSGAGDARTLAGVDERVRAAVDLELDGGELPGTPSTVVDVSGFDAGDDPVILREGALAPAQVRAALASARRAAGARR